MNDENDKPRVDLHLHTTASDGTLSPLELMARAGVARLALVAITDHDTVQGYRQVREAWPAEAGRLISGVEWSAQGPHGHVHVVGLGMDTDCPAFAERIARQQALRPKRAERIAQQLGKCGIPDTLPGAMALAGEGSVGRLHFARHLVSRGVVHSEDEAFRRYLGDGARACVSCDWPAMAEVIAWTHEAGGVAVLAHPLKYRMTRTKLARMVTEFAGAGGDAIEWPVVIDKDTARWLKRIILAAGLKISLGSDFHGPDMRWNAIGRVASPPEGLEPVWSRWLVPAATGEGV